MKTVHLRPIGRDLTCLDTLLFLFSGWEFGHELGSIMVQVCGVVKIVFTVPNDMFMMTETCLLSTFSGLVLMDYHSDLSYSPCPLPFEAWVSLKTPHQLYWFIACWTISKISIADFKFGLEFDVSSMLKFEIYSNKKKEYILYEVYTVIKYISPCIMILLRDHLHC